MPRFVSSPNPATAPRPTIRGRMRALWRRFSAFVDAHPNLDADGEQW